MGFEVVCRLMTMPNEFRTQIVESGLRDPLLTIQQRLTVLIFDNNTKSNLNEYRRVRQEKAWAIIGIDVTISIDHLMDT